MRKFLQTVIDRVYYRRASDATIQNLPEQADIGTVSAAESVSGDGTLIGITKRLRTIWTSVWDSSNNWVQALSMRLLPNGTGIGDKAGATLFTSTANILAGGTLQSAWLDCRTFDSLGVDGLYSNVGGSTVAKFTSAAIDFSDDNGATIFNSITLVDYPGLYLIQHCVRLADKCRLTLVKDATATASFKVNLVGFKGQPPAYLMIAGDSPASRSGFAIPTHVPVRMIDSADNLIKPVTPTNPVYDQLVDRETGRVGYVDPRRALSVAEPTRLQGMSFNGTVLDTVDWDGTTGATGTGAVTLPGDGTCRLRTGATANSRAVLTAQRPGRYLASIPNRYFGGIKLDGPVANNKRRWGLFRPSVGISSDGFFFELQNAASVVAVSRQAGVDTATALNGPNAFVYDTLFHDYDIVHTAGSAWFYQDRKLVHTMTDNVRALAASMDLRMGYENINSGGSTTDVSMYLRGQAQQRLGKGDGRTDYSVINAAGNTLIKRGSGTLKGIIWAALGPAGATVNIYDGIDNTGRLIYGPAATSTLGGNPIDFDQDFETGLFIVTAGTLGVPTFTVLYD